MYLHLGQKTVVRAADVIGIFDIETTSVSKLTRWFLSNAEKNLMVTNVSNDLPKSFIVCDDKTGVRIYISQISSATLKKRAGCLEDL